MPAYCVNIPPGAPVMARPWPAARATAGSAGDGVDRVDESRQSSAANSTVSRPPAVSTNGTTGEREWATPTSAVGIQLTGHSPPALPRVRAWTVRSFDIARMPWPLTVGGATAVPPVA